jgi:putative ABC transport system permease protein
VSARNLLHLYRVRLRARFVQELFALMGIAAGVALLFASQVATSSLASSAAALARGVIGHANLQLIARSASGMPASLAARAHAVPGVRVAAPLLEAQANARGPRGAASVELVGADETLATLGGSLATRVHLAPFANVGAVVLPTQLARRVGVTRFEQELTLEAFGRVAGAPLYAQLGPEQIGALADTPIAVAPLFYAQEVTGLAGRVSRILVETSAGAEKRVSAALARIAGSEADVRDPGYDQRLFSLAATATNQSTELFAAISALVGFLFAFNAMLLTVPQRRRLITELRRDGYEPRSVIAVMAFDALMLGLLGSALGLVIGDELSIHLFHANPGYLSSAFTVGSARVVSVQSVLFAVLGGFLAAGVAVLSPLRDIVSRDPLAATAARGEGGAAHSLWLTLVAVVLFAAASAILIAAPNQAVIGSVALLGAMLLLLAPVLGRALALVRALAPHVTSAIPHVAVFELQAARVRAVAIAATGAIAVFATVAIETAHGDLLRGLEGAAHDMNAFTDVWVSPSGSFNLLKTAPFAGRAQAKLARLPGVRAVDVYRGGLLDWGTRRVWVIAPPASAMPMPPGGQVVDGSAARASARLRAGGWATLSRALAEDHHLHIGSSFVLPSPVPTRLRVAAITTNVGWPPGAIVMSAAQYASAWGSDAPSAYNILVRPDVTPGHVASEVRGALGGASGLTVETADAHVGEQRALSRQGLARLLQIATLIVVAAVMAMAAAMGSMVWQRRARLAKLKLEGFARALLWRTIVLESVVLLGVGCLTGAAFGLYGQLLLDRALARVIGFPVTYAFGGVIAVVGMAVVTAAAVAAVAVPGWLAAGVPAAVALEE